MAGIKLQKAGEARWRIPREGSMQVEGVVYATDELLKTIRDDESLRQVVNVAQLPGIVKASIAMPDIHYGYGFPIGGVAAFPAEDGIVSPGGVGYDINCGVRVLRLPLQKEDVEKEIHRIVDALFSHVPAGLGRGGPLKLSKKDLKKVAREGAVWVINRGMGLSDDLESIEDGGRIDGADPDAVSDRAYDRGSDQLGTVGSGNHFVEIGYVDKVYDPEIARLFGLEEGTATVLIHSGSRGFGHQICDDTIRALQSYVTRKNINLPDRQLVYARVNDPEGRKYLGAMKSAINYAFANRAIIAHFVREVLKKVLKIPYDQIALVYDVGHNIAKEEEHVVDGERIKLIVHRKGATRGLPAGDSRLPLRYRGTGQPVIIPGDMGRASYILVAESRALEETFGTVCHGAGRNLSRAQAKKRARGRQIDQELKRDGVVVRSHSRATLAEEMPEAYKDVSEVVHAVEAAGLARAVARLKPLGVIKG